MLTRQEAIEDNQGIVIKLARRYSCKQIEFHDLVQAGNMGLLEAYERFDPDRGVQFLTYAYNWIRKAIKEEVANAHLVRLPQNVQRIRNQVAQVSAEHYSENGEQLDAEELADILDTDTALVENAQQHDGVVVHIDEDLQDDQSIEERVSVSILGVRLNHAFQNLNDKDKKILHLRNEGHTLYEIAAQLGYTPERIRQRQNNAIARLRLRARI